MNKRVFVVSGGRLDAYGWHGALLEEPFTFTADEQGFARFSLYLESEPSIPTYILADVVEEEFREETIPFVRWPPDRRSSQQLRLTRMFRDTTYGRAEPLGRESTGRRDEKVLFSALTRPELLAPWVSQCVRHQVPLVGVYSVPAITRLLLKPIGAETSHALIVSIQRSGGLRQSFFQDGRLKLSRLAVMPRVSRRAHASYVLGEIEKTRRFLNSMRMLPHNNPLEVFLMGEYALLEELRRQSPDSVTTRHTLLQLDDVTSRIGLKGEYDARFADAVFVHLLARKSPPNQYAPASQTRYGTMYNLSKGLKIASVAAVLGGVLVAAYEASEGVVATQDAQAAKDDTAFFSQRYERARAQLPETPVHPREMKAMVEIAAELELRKETPRAFLNVLGASLNDFPSLQLDAVDWAMQGPPAPARGARTSGGSSAPAPGDEQLEMQNASVRGHIAPFGGNYRAALSLVNRFADSLREQSPVREVEVVVFPISVSSLERMSGDTQADLAAAEAPFELRVVLEPTFIVESEQSRI